MGLKETENTTEVVLERMENTMLNLEQMSYDSINITDHIVTLLSDARELLTVLKSDDEEKKQEAFKGVEDILNQLLNTSFEVNNVSHELERETVYQRETVESIKQIVDYLYSISDEDMF
ncbi:hypothetical protein KQI69_02015 [Eubacterium sp. MSJ-13]|uniref:hypothetical protein n=1 Tax=Eubacterium sp. MSJ-13 TaxID=2841513 RepID=UPI001C113D41|nr:hypothetical protein [Eubacterium sp. MSJ-13]MBU5477973.1 hypothetical protein [Eubacterium sp. MSJ-13]